MKKSCANISLYIYKIIFTACSRLLFNGTVIKNNSKYELNRNYYYFFNEYIFTYSIGKY